MTSYSHDMTFHREDGRMRLLKTFKQTHMYFCMSDVCTTPARCTCLYIIVYQHLIKYTVSVVLDICLV